MEPIKKLQIQMKHAVKDYWNALPVRERYCLHCKHFRWHAARAGAPENTPTARCEYHNVGWSCGNPNQVDRLMECLVEGDREELDQQTEKD